MQRPKLVLLDRDGVINRDSDAFVKSPDEWIPIAGSMDAMGALSRAGIRVMIVSNQSGLGRGLFDYAALRAMHDKLRAGVGSAGGSVDAIFYCPHRPDSGCACRKPAATMLEDALKLSGSDPDDALAIGDSARDLEAAHSAGVRAWLVRTGNGQSTERMQPELADAIYDDLATAVGAILAGHD